MLCCPLAEPAVTSAELCDPTAQVYRSATGTGSQGLVSVIIDSRAKSYVEHALAAGLVQCCGGRHPYRHELSDRQYSRRAAMFEKF